MFAFSTYKSKQWNQYTGTRDQKIQNRQRLTVGYLSLSSGVSFHSASFGFGTESEMRNGRTDASNFVSVLPLVVPLQYVTSARPIPTPIPTGPATDATTASKAITHPCARKNNNLFFSVP
jgi:hypothetical protein